MEPTFQGRDDWLALLAELFDEQTIERLERIGVGAGWHALEVGAGRGSIAAWLASRVGPRGRVVATDIDTRFLKALGDPAVEVLEHDVLGDDFPEGSYELIHCRAVLLLLPDPRLAIDRMVRWLKPGGVLLAEEPWIEAATLSPEPVTARAVAGLDAASSHLDTSFARLLPMALREAGLEHVQGEGKIAFFDGGSGPAAFFRMALEGYCDRLIAAGRLEPGDMERLRARYEDPGWIDCGWPRIAAWGRKPEPPAGWRQRLADGRRRVTARLSHERGGGAERSINRSTAIRRLRSPTVSSAAR